MQGFKLIPPTRTLRTPFHIPEEYKNYEVTESGGNGANGVIR